MDFNIQKRAFYTKFRLITRCRASISTMKAPPSEGKGGGGRWGVVPASEHQEILIALASLIRAQRYEMALTILDNELGDGG